MHINQQDAQNSVMRLYFPLDIIRVAIATRIISAYTKCDVQLIKLLLMMD